MSNCEGGTHVLPSSPLTQMGFTLLLAEMPLLPFAEEDRKEGHLSGLGFGDDHLLDQLTPNHILLSRPSRAFYLSTQASRSSDTMAGTSWSSITLLEPNYCTSSDWGDRCIQMENRCVTQQQLSSFQKSHPPSGLLFEPTMFMPWFRIDIPNWIGDFWPDYILFRPSMIDIQY